MKVNVLQAKDIKFNKWKWWSNWIDIATYEHNMIVYLVQMKVSRDNGKKFKTTRVAGGAIKSVRIAQISDLTQMENSQ